MPGTKCRNSQYSFVAEINLVLYFIINKPPKRKRQNLNLI